MKVPYINLNKQYLEEREDLIKIFDRVLKTGNYISGEFVNEFEENIAKYCCSKYCVGFNSGTDALTIALFILGVRRGDEVITTPNSFVASASAIIHLGATPVFVDVLDDQNINPELIEEKITEKTKVIMPVHLTGRVCKMEKIIKIAKKRHIKVIEDAAQAIGSKYNNKFSGTFGDIGCFSAHPLKNLNAVGDSGYFITDSKKIYDQAKLLRSHGMINRNIVKHFGYVSRMDNLQAAILNYRLKKLPEVIEKRRKNASLYFNLIDKKKVFIPIEKKEEFNSYHTFVIQVRKRDKLIKFLQKKKINTSIHYPTPIHLQPAAKRLGYKKGDFINAENQSKKILTLPINQFLTSDMIKFISRTINQFYN
jgi:dTDP-4-amino-4,6-dideoxygalactose transaminase